MNCSLALPFKTNHFGLPFSGRGAGRGSWLLAPAFKSNHFGMPFFFLTFLETFWAAFFCARFSLNLCTISPKFVLSVVLVLV